MMSSRLLSSLLCNNVQTGILDMAYLANIFMVYGEQFFYIAYFLI